jgi:radical SAM protein with 4Fe4S-binding SPASM domain
LRSLFHVELDNEWGSAGADDCFYRDDPFVCGAGRHSCVVSATGEVMPCTTTDPAESQGNVRDQPLSEIWATGFRAFRQGGDRLRGDCGDFWLQTRHGHSCRPAFFLDLLTEIVPVGARRGGAA